MSTELHMINTLDTSHINDDDISIYEDENGQFIVNVKNAKPVSTLTGFHEENLADKLDEETLNSIAQDISGSIESDKESRQVWESQLEDGMRLLGLQKEEKTWPFPNASTNYSSALCETWLNTSAIIISEILPPTGPAKSDVLGDSSDAKIKKAERIEDWFNLYLTRLNKSFYPDMEQAIMWAVNNGSVFIKTYIDPVKNMPVSLFIRPDEFIVDAAATSLELASRLTHQLVLTGREIKLRQESGLYRDFNLFPDSNTAIEKSIVQSRIEQIEGIQITSWEHNKQYVLYECHVDIDLEKYLHQDTSEEDKRIPKPYIITIDRDSNKILSIYRNWEEKDPTFKRIECFVPFTYVPGFGMYGLGLFHIASNNAKTATDISRQMIDAGTLANFPGGVRVKGMRFKENNVRVGPTEFVELETGGLPIQQAIMPLPYKGPDPILKEIKDDAEEKIRNLAGAANSQISEMNSNTPVGTILAVIEQAQKIQSSVVQRMHRSMGDLFEILYRLFAKVLPDAPYPFHIAGKSHAIMRTDFTDDIHIVPVSDPNLSSFPQRALTVETILNTAKEFPDLHNMHAVLERYYKILKVSNIDEILLPPPEDTGPQPKDPITENADAMNNAPLQAFVFQEHDAHIMVHSYVMNNPTTPPEVVEALKAHIQEHNAFKYKLMMQQAIGMELPENIAEVSPEDQNKIAMAAAAATEQMVQEQLQAAPPTVEEVALQEIAMKDKGNEMKAQTDMAKVEVEKIKVEMETQIAAEKLAMEEMRIQFEKQKAMQELEIKKLQLENDAYKAQLKYHSEEDKLLAQEDIDNNSIDKL